MSNETLSLLDGELIAEFRDGTLVIRLEGKSIFSSEELTRMFISAIGHHLSTQTLPIN